MYYTQLYPSARDSSKMTDCTVEESKDYIQLCKNDIRMSICVQRKKKEINLNFGQSSSHFEINVTKTKHFAINFSIFEKLILLYYCSHNDKFQNEPIKHSQLCRQRSSTSPTIPTNYSKMGKS